LKFHTTTFTRYQNLRCANCRFISSFLIHIEYSGSVHFRNIYFIERLAIKGAFGGRTNFIEVSFYKPSSFSELTCKGDFFFETISIYKRVEFFVKNQFQATANFNDIIKTEDTEGLFFYDTIFYGPVSFTEINECMLSFNLCKFESVLSISTVLLRELLISATTFNSVVEINDLNIKKGAREVFRQLKHQVLINNNKIDALEFHKLEMNAFKSEIKYRKWNNPDKAILFLNSTSNSHGTNPWIGIVFVMGVIY